MRKVIAKLSKPFAVVMGNRRSQAAEMVLRRGDAEGDSRNRHKGADQWLYVVAGAGVAMVNGVRHDLKKGSLLLIERGDEHEIRQTGKAPLRTLNIYVPPVSIRRHDAASRPS